MKPKAYIANNIDKLSLSDRYTIARILVFKTYDLIESNNGLYILFDNTDEETIHEIYILLKTRLISWFELTNFVCSNVSYNIYIQ